MGKVIGNFIQCTVYKLAITPLMRQVGNITLRVCFQRVKICYSGAKA